MNTEELRRELQQRVRDAGLEWQCGSDGPITAQCAIIAEAPGRKEVTAKVPRPLIGGSGSYWWTLARQVGIRRTEVYTTNVIKRQVSFMDQAKKAIGEAELAHWEGILEWELSQLPNLTHVIMLGNHALRALTGAEGVLSWRSSVVNVKIGDRECTGFVTFNPAYPLRTPMMKPVFEMDVAKLGRVLDGSFKLPSIVPHYDPSPDEAIEWLDRLQDEKKPIAYDIEFSSGQMDCIGFANSYRRGYCINFRDQTDNRWTNTEELRVRRRIQRLLADDEMQFIVQNGAFDAGWLWFRERIYVVRHYFDTMLGHHTLYPLMPHSLEFLTSQYTDHPYYKDEREEWKEGGDIATRWVYNVKDCCVTWQVASKMLRELKAQGLDEFFFNHVMRAQPHLVGMQVLGVKADMTLKQKIIDDLSDELREKYGRFAYTVAEAAGADYPVVNPNSPQQLSKLFFQHLKLIGRNSSTDAENRQAIRAHPRTPPAARVMLDALDDYKDDQKFLSTYAESQLDEDGYFRCEYKQTGTTRAPGRLSSSKTMWGNGLNLQNQPERSKVMFLTHGVCDDDPDDFWEFSYYDLAQAEAKVVAFAWDVKALRANFLAAESGGGLDVHRLNASTIFKAPYDEIPSFDHYVYANIKKRNTDDPKLEGKPTRRFLGKRCVHGLNYRMGADKLARVCGIPYGQALEAWNSYHRAFPEIQLAWKDTVREFRERGELWSYMGRRFRVVGEITDEVMDSVIAFKPQSTIGDKVTQTIYQLQEDPEWPRNRDGTMRARVRLNIHDALIAENRHSDGDTVRRLMRKHAESPIVIRGTPVRILADLAVSQPDEYGVHRWSTIEKIKRVA